VRSLRIESRVAGWSYRGDPACDRAQVADPLGPRHSLAVNKHLDNNTKFFVVACGILRIRLHLSRPSVPYDEKLYFTGEFSFTYKELTVFIKCHGDY